MRVLISGASGLIGTALAKSLRSRGDEVVSLVRPQGHEVGGATVEWDPSAGQIDRTALDAIGPLGAVVHLAGAGIADKRWSQERRDEIMESRRASTSLLAASLGDLAERPLALISGSAIGIYGNRGDEIITEESSLGEDFLAEVCREWEAAAAPAIDAGIRTAFIRTGIVLATEGGALAKQLPLFKAGLGGKLGPGSQWLSWITLDDEVAAILHLIDTTSLEGAFNLTAPDPVTNAHFTTALGHLLHRPTFLSVPAFALRAALGAQLVDDALLASQRVHPSRLEASGFVFGSPVIDGALKEVLGR